MAESDRYKGALKDDAPAEIAEALHALVGRDAVVRLYLKADCAKDGSFGRTDLVLTDTHFLALPEAEEAIATALTDIKGAYVLPVVGGRFLVWELEDGSSHKVGVSESLWAEAAELTRAIHQVRDGNPIALQEMDRKNCDQCGRRLPEIDSICPKCVKWRVIFWRIAAYLKPYWPKAAFLTLLAAISTATSLLPPLLTKKMIDEVLVPVDEFGNQGPDQRFRGLLWVVFLQMLLHVGGWGLQFLHKRTSSWLGARITLDIRNQMYAHLLRLPVRYHDRKELGVLMARVSNDAGALNDFLISGIPDLFLNFLSFWGILYISLTLSPKLTAIVLIPVPFMWAWSAMTKKKMYPHHLRSWMVESRYWGKLWEIFFGIRAVKAFNQENREVKAFAERSDKVHALHLEVNRMNSRLGAFGGFIGFGATLALYLVGGADVVHGVMTIGALMAFQAYMGQLYGPLLWFADLGGWLHKAFTGAARIFEILDTREEGLVADEPGPIKRIEGHVQFKDVCFGYDPTKLVLDHVNLDVPAGETVGVVGRSGAGKTTAINLLCRFYDPSDGAILVDGKDLREYPPGALRSQIGIVLQDAFLFSGTISDNIRYANKKATFAQVIDAAKVANAHNFITNMGDGYDTEAGERGCHLSGGEKQRIGIARAVIRDPRILILDEATASLDSVTEREIQKAMIELRKGRTTFIIAHRLATLRGADKIIVFDDGKICEMGPWPELMAKKGALWDLVQAQKAIEAEALD